MLPDCRSFIVLVTAESSQCTYRCVALPDMTLTLDNTSWSATSQCTCRCVVLPDPMRIDTNKSWAGGSQCTCRCVVLPDLAGVATVAGFIVSMHLQVRGAP